MSLFSCSGGTQVAQSWNAMLHFPSSMMTKRRSLLDFRSLNSQLVGNGNKPGNQWSFVGGSRVVIKQEAARVIHHRKGIILSASCSQIATNAFTLGTISVLPFYALMIVAPNARVTKGIMQSSVPYIVLGILYAYLLYLSWSPDTLRVLFASKHWLPELPGMTEMFSRQMTMASAWIHLLAVDLFAARQVFHDGLMNMIPTWHSITLCLFFCPIGITSHAITKLLTKKAK